MEQELAYQLQEDRISYLTHVEIPVTIADFYLPVETRPLLVFVDGPVHLSMEGRRKRIDEEKRRKRLEELKEAGFYEVVRQESPS